MEQMAPSHQVRKMSLEEFKKHPAPAGTEQFLNRLTGGSFMECHTAIFAQTGIWVEDLVPVFQKLDAMLLTKQLPAALR